MEYIYPFNGKTNKKALVENKTFYSLYKKHLRKILFYYLCRIIKPIAYKQK